jgi:hypothetical protein
MKATVFGLIFLVLVIILGVGGFLVYRSMPKSHPAAQGTIYKTEAVHKIGVIQPGKGDDYSYMIVTPGKLEGINSYTVDLSTFVGKKVEAVGQYSGTTLYADTITLAQ